MENKNISSNEDLVDSMPFIALIYTIQKNQIKYLENNLANYNNISFQARFLVKIYDNEDLSQDDLVKFFNQSKGNIAKSLKKLEDSGYIKRKINPKNRRKYILKTTSKGDSVVQEIKKINKEWEERIGFNTITPEIRKELKKIVIKSIEVNNEYK